jgi:dolichol-phosphate mannosyltransferase
MARGDTKEELPSGTGALPDVSVVLPTYNEAGNIERIIPRICSSLMNSGIDCEVLVVDDDSPDGTAVLAEHLSPAYPVRVHVRKGNRGLATAVMEGFDLSRGKVCVVMDADMSHPVERLPDMVRPVLQGDCDATVGSRYTGAGGSHDWPLLRRVVSRGSGLLAKGLTRLTDPTSGFMAIRRSLIDTRLLDPVGWKIVLEAIVKLKPSFTEVPIVFTDREAGTSKLDRKVQADYVRHLWRLYCHKYATIIQFLKFCVVGLSGLVVDTVVVVGLVETVRLDPRLAAVFAFLVAVTWNYGLNSVWTFAASTRRLYGYVTFVVVSCLGLGIRLGVMHLLLEYAGLWKGRYYVLASVAGVLCATLFNYSGSKYVSFRKTMERDRCAQENKQGLPPTLRRR